MIIKYDNIYSRFLQKIEDIEFLQLDKNTAYRKMAGWLNSAISDPYVRRIFETYELNDEILELWCTVRHAEDEVIDQQYVEEVLSLGMLVTWLESKVQSTVNIKQGLFGKEQKYYSQAAHLEQIRGLFENCQTRLRRMISDRGYMRNSWLEMS